MTKHNTGIEWTHIPGYKGETWNPIVGCSIDSPGCKNCYAMRRANRLLDGNPKTPHYAGTTKKVNGKPVWTGKVARASEKTLTAPLRWGKPRAIFVNSMGDLFHENVQDEWIDEVFYMMHMAARHIFIILTKRPERMKKYMEDLSPWHRVKRPRLNEIFGSEERAASADYFSMVREQPWPLPNVWLGVSVEDQKRADERIPYLLETPAAVRFISCEPLLGVVDLNTAEMNNDPNLKINPLRGALPAFQKLDWVIAGGESGPHARPMHPRWLRSLRDQCQAANTPFFFKQWGEWVSVSEVEGAGPSYYFESGATVRRVGKARAGRTLDGIEHTEFPKINGVSNE